MAKLPIAEFLESRLKEYDPAFEVRKGTSFQQLIFKPLEFIIQPFRDEANIIQTGQSFRRILLTDDPDSFDEETVDDLISNFFVERATGAFSAGVARVYFDAPVSREWPEGGAVFAGSNGKSYVNTAPFAITNIQMGAQIEGGLYYYDIPVIALEAGSDSDLDAGGLISLAGDPDVITVTNKIAFSGGRARETNTQVIERTKKSIAVRDLVTGKGFNATLFENFPSTLTELQPIGFGDQEMMRDILFNTHVGGKVDGYVKTPNILTKTKNFIGLLIDTTREVFSSTAVQLINTDFASMGTTNISRVGGNDPVVKQIKDETSAELTSLITTFPINLSVNRYIKIAIDGEERQINLQGANPTFTTKFEIISRINYVFGKTVAFATPTGFKLVSPTKGTNSSVSVNDPSVPLPSALIDVFGVMAYTEVYGDGPIVFVEGTDYAINDNDGEIQRIVRPIFISTQSTGDSTTGSDIFTDPTLGIFSLPSLVAKDMVLTILSGPDAGDYRILEVTNANTLVLDAELTDTSSAVQYLIREGGIKNGEAVYVEYYFNPLSIDIGKYIKLDDLGTNRGIRPGRDDQTISDVAFLRVKKIELIDPITEEPLGEILNGAGGYGVGGYGEGPYGIGSGTDYYMVINSVHERYSAFEDSLIVINPSYQGFSFAVEYEYVPEIEDFHNFCRSESERVLDGDILVKHFIPAYVSGEIQYSIDATDSEIPTNEQLTEFVKQFIDLRPAGSVLDYSDLRQFITRVTDPFDRFGASVKSFELTATVLNTDGSTLIVTGSNELTIPTLDPFPKDTKRPLSPRIAHWISDNITLTRIDS